MKKLFVSVALCVILPVLALAAPVGTVQFIEGTVTLTRAGADPVTLDFGSAVENYDVVKTDARGRCVIELDASTGMSGTLTVKPKSTVAIRTDGARGTARTETQMLAGSVALKLRKLSGNPQFTVRTSTTVMGVRGTTFEVQTSVNANLLVTCSEGRVSCRDEQSGSSADAVPGQIVLADGTRLSAFPVAVGSLDEYRERWGAEQIEAFKANALAALDQYAAAYRRYKSQLEASFAPLRADQTLETWIAQSRKGQAGSANDPRTMREKSLLAPKLMAVKRVIFLMEPIWYRLEEVRTYVGAQYLNHRLSFGQTVGEFYAQYQADFRDLERMGSQFRQALKLYAERNGGKEPVSMSEMSDDEDDFFSDM